MGGFKVTVDEKYKSILCNGSTLTPMGVLRLEEIRGLPHLTREMITDKSKMDYLAKGFLEVWFLAQIISRWAGELTVTLLELNTLAHTLCAVALWAFWWRRKPKDVNVPVEIKMRIQQRLQRKYTLGCWTKKRAIDWSIRSRQKGCIGLFVGLDVERKTFQGLQEKARVIH